MAEARASATVPASAAASAGRDGDVLEGELLDPNELYVNLSAEPAMAAVAHGTPHPASPPSAAGAAKVATTAVAAASTGAPMQQSSAPATLNASVSHTHNPPRDASPTYEIRTP